MSMQGGTSGDPTAARGGGQGGTSRALVTLQALNVAQTGGNQTTSAEKGLMGEAGFEPA
jgi:hypothetical protein